MSLKSKPPKPRGLQRNIRTIRCRRGSETSSGHSSCSSSEVSSFLSALHSDSGMSCMDLGSIAEHVFEDLSIHGNAKVPATSTRSSTTVSSSSTRGNSTSDTDATETTFNANTSDVISQHNGVSGDIGKFVLNFNVSSAEDSSLYELFRQILDWLDPELEIFKECHTRLSDKTKDKGYYSVSTLDIPSLAIVLFVQEDGGKSTGSRTNEAKAFFSTRPWKVHHSEWVGGTMQMYPENSHDYYILTPDRPLCSVRQIHCGSEHLRVMRYVTSKHWKDTIDFYKLILDRHPNVLKKDFCLFTVQHQTKYDLQFALKKLPRGTVPKKTRKVEMCFYVSSIGSLVPLLPNPCHKMSEIMWATRDLDGNKIYLKVSPPKLQKRCRSVSPSKLMSRTNRSAFSPVVPAKPRPRDDNGVYYARATHNISLMDKLSPRVYVTKKANTSVIPKRPLSSSSRNSDSSTGISSVSQNIITQDLVNDIFSHYHNHTDSGFVEEKIEPPRDPRRTPIIGTHLSRFTQYDRYISTPDGEVCFKDHPHEPEELTPRATAQPPKGLSEESLAWVERYVESQNEQLTKLSPSPLLSPRVTPTNHPSPCITPTNHMPAPSNTTSHRLQSPCITPTNKMMSPCVTPTNVQHALGQNATHNVDTRKAFDGNGLHFNGTNSHNCVQDISENPQLPHDSLKPPLQENTHCTCGSKTNRLSVQVYGNGDSNRPIPNQGIPCNKAATISTTSNNSANVSKILSLQMGDSDSGKDTMTSTSSELSPELADAELLTPRCPSVEVSSHDLHEYMKLQWGTKSEEYTSSNRDTVRDSIEVDTAIKSNKFHVNNQGNTRHVDAPPSHKKPPLPPPKRVRGPDVIVEPVYENCTHNRSRTPLSSSSSGDRLQENSPQRTNGSCNSVQTLRGETTEFKTFKPAIDSISHTNSENSVPPQENYRISQVPTHVAKKGTENIASIERNSQQRAAKSDCVKNFVKQFEASNKAKSLQNLGESRERNNSSEAIPEKVESSSDIGNEQNSITSKATGTSLPVRNPKQSHIVKAGTTLGQFLSQNKKVSEFLRKRSPTNTPPGQDDSDENTKADNENNPNLPDLVQRNSILAPKQNSNVINESIPRQMSPQKMCKEGTPEDLSQTRERGYFSSVTSDCSVFDSSPSVDSDTSLQSCILKPSNKPKKRVRISEMNNTHHLYEAGQEHGFNINDVATNDDSDSDDDVESNNANELVNNDDVAHSYANELDHDDVVQGCYNLKSGISTVYDTNTSRVSQQPLEPNMDTLQSNPSVSLRGNSSPCSVNNSNVSNINLNPVKNENPEWKRIKENPSVGFYI